MAQTLVLEPQLPSHIVHQFPMPTFIENLAIRFNGKILVTIVNPPSLMMVDPRDPSIATLIHRFEGVLAATGVIEVEYDIFYVAGGNFDLKAGGKNESGSYSIWRVDMNGFEETGKATIEKLTSLPDAGLPNGFTSLTNDKTCFLFADSEAGNVVKVNVQTAASEVLIDLEEMKHGAAGMPLGINGIKFKDGYLYWTTTVKEIFCRIKVDDHGNPVGKAETLAKDILADDFALDKNGNAWLTTHSKNTIVVVKADGSLVTVAGKLNELTVAGGTACQFGRGRDDGHVLYVTTCGGLTAPVDGHKVEGGKIVAIDTSKFE